MGFSNSEKEKMLRLKGVGPTVIARLEQVGFSSLSQLKTANPEDVAKQVSQMLGSTCWHNSPQARASIQAVIDLAKDKKLKVRA